MQWGQIKTLLIVSFLILNIYLFIQLMEKKEEADIGILEQHTSSIEEQLRDDGITYGTLPDKEYEETFISVKPFDFTEEALQSERKLKSQRATIVQQHLIVSTLEEGLSLSDTSTKEQLMNTFGQLVYFADEYTFWNWNKEYNILIFFQNKFDRPVYYNQNGLVLLFLDKDNEVKFYMQTMLGEAEALAEKRELMKPMEAIETLYRANELELDSHIDHVNIGFHTRVPFETDIQVLAPIWKVQVNKEKNYFINAIEGFIFSTDEKEFLQEVIAGFADEIRIQRHKDSDLEEIYDYVTNLLEDNN